MLKLNRRCLSAIGIVGCALVLVPSAAQARKHPSPNGRHNLSIALSDNPVVAGDQLVIFGRLRGPNNGHRVVTLWHRINPKPAFTPVERTSTDANGFYAFFRQPGVVNTNRNWYVKSLGARSRTVHERVFSLVTLTGPADGSNLETGPAHKVTFSGTVAPFTVGDSVLLQRQNADTGKGWGTIDRGKVRPGGTYSITHTFRVPGDANIRVLVRGTRRNIASASNVLSYEISQAQNPNLTLTPSADPITVGQSVVLTGQPPGWRRPADSAARGDPRPAPHPGGDDHRRLAGQLLVHPDAGAQHDLPGQGRGQVLGAAVRGREGPAHGVGDAGTISAGQSVTFSGTVAPNKAGHVIYLQRQNPTGNGFHTVQVTNVGPGSVYSITRRLFTPGTKVFRVLIPGGPSNQGAASSPFTITVNPATAQQISAAQPDTTEQG